MRRLADELNQQGHSINHTKVGQLLNTLGYSLQAIRKIREGDTHPDRDKQFNHIFQQVQRKFSLGARRANTSASSAQVIPAAMRKSELQVWLTQKHIPFNSLRVRMENQIST